MNNERSRSKLTISRIDYIVTGNPDQVGKMVERYGHKQPGSIKELSKTVRKVIRKEGQKAVVDLVRLHPDRDAILAAEARTVKDNGTTEILKPHLCSKCGNARSNTEDGYCGCNHSYDRLESNYDESLSKQDLSKLTVNELMSRYESLSKEAANNADNKPLADEVMRTWNEIRKRNETPNKSSAPFALTFCQATLIVVGIIQVINLILNITATAMRSRVA